MFLVSLCTFYIGVNTLYQVYCPLHILDELVSKKRDGNKHFNRSFHTPMWQVVFSKWLQQISYRTSSYYSVALALLPLRQAFVTGSREYGKVTICDFQG